MEASSMDIRLVHRMAALCLQVAEDTEYHPSVSDWSRLIQTLQARVPVLKAYQARISSLNRSMSMLTHGQGMPCYQLCSPACLKMPTAATPLQMSNDCAVSSTTL